MRPYLVVLAVAAGCRAASSFGDCEVSCAASLACPAGLTCGAEGLCRAPDTAAQSCAAVLGDAGLDRDAPGGGDPDAPDAPGTLPGARADLIVVNVGGTTVHRSSGSRFEAGASWSPEGTDNNLAAARYQLADVGGDGRADQMIVGVTSISVRHTLANRFDLPTVWASEGTDNNLAAGRYRLADVDGDHRADLIHVGVASITVRRSTGTAFDAPVTWAAEGTDNNLAVARYRLADVDRDGRADLVYVGVTAITARRSTGTAFDTATTWAAEGTDNNLAVARYQLADVDGDRRADLMYVGVSTIAVRRSTGTAFDAATTWANGGTDNNLAVLRYQLADVDHDGRADLAVVGVSALTVGLSTGTGFGSFATWAAEGTDNNLAVGRYQLAEVVVP